MSLSYDLYIRHEVYHDLQAISSRRREPIVALLESLPSDPFQAGDFEEVDRDGRPCKVMIVGKYAVYFWADHPAKEIRVLDLIDADQT